MHLGLIGRHYVMIDKNIPLFLFPDAKQIVVCGDIHGDRKGNCRLHLHRYQRTRHPAHGSEVKHYCWENFLCGDVCTNKR